MSNNHNNYSRSTQEVNQSTFVNQNEIDPSLFKMDATGLQISKNTKDIVELRNEIIQLKQEIERLKESKVGRFNVNPIMK
tara:strand:- start:5647 stop:5886 length:240 start_codon:yes stop_codon:yes gene_type:complete